MANLRTNAGIKDARTELFNKLYTILEEGIGPDRFFPDPAPMVRLLADAENQLRQEFFQQQAGATVGFDEEATDHL